MKAIKRITVCRRPGSKDASQNSAGLMRIEGRAYPCVLGRSGISVLKREGDGTTPAGCYRLLFGFYQKRAGKTLLSSLPLSPIAPDDGWCDAPCHRLYNRHVKLPLAASHEKLWRDDTLYDVVIVPDHNYSRRQRGRGSAVFFHLTGDKPYTEGCVGIDRDLMKKLLPRLSGQTIMQIIA